MELAHEGSNVDGEIEERERLNPGEPSFRKSHVYRHHFPGMVRKKAYIFDGHGKYYIKEWDLTDGIGNEFSWYHVELPKGSQKLAQSAQYLIDVLCPPLKLQDILSLVSNGPFCGLGFSPMGQSLLSEIPSVENHRGEPKEGSGIVIREHVLEFLLTMNHSEEADNPVPKSLSNLVVHIVDTHVDHLQDVVTKLEIELDSVELELDKGGFALKKQMLEERRFPKMHLNLQRLLQVISYGEQVFPRVKERCSSKHWFSSDDINALEELTGRLRRLKENVGFITNRVTAIQAGLDSWQAEQINRKLYYLSFLSIALLPLSIITGVFGMNVGGVPWTLQEEPKDGFRNVVFLCVAMLLLVLLCFLCPAAYSRIAAWQRRRAMRRSWSLNRKSFLKRSVGVQVQGRGGYLRL
ncbi:hypothetical protein KPL71_022542 [Citrus sinensis]|uniref:Uncharacterized protein n=1 Tax=Citrus sinensis TaxID=2711 RepID=A0ACB8ICX2_CITSI|nr:hypothetical protein KPL71_022542 [Citrus sinensis]